MKKAKKQEPTRWDLWRPYKGFKLEDCATRPGSLEMFYKPSRYQNVNAKNKTPD